MAIRLQIGYSHFDNRLGVCHILVVAMNRSKADEALIGVLRRKVIELENEAKRLRLELEECKFRRKMDIERSETKPIIRSQSNRKG